MKSVAAKMGRQAARRLRALDVCDIAPGLSDAEFDAIEAEFGFEFADDHRAFLAAGLPVNTRPRERDPNVYYAWDKPWPDWRDGDRIELRAQLDHPVRGVLFDIEHGWWPPEWGERPTDAVTEGRKELEQVPKLVPVYGHRYLPAGRGSFDHPVLSVWQTDIIYYGLNLPDYIDREFTAEKDYDDWSPKATVEFWKRFVEDEIHE